MRLGGPRGAAGATNPPQAAPADRSWSARRCRWPGAAERSLLGAAALVKIALVGLELVLGLHARFFLPVELRLQLRDLYREGRHA